LINRPYLFEIASLLSNEIKDTYLTRFKTILAGRSPSVPVAVYSGKTDRYYFDYATEA